MPQMSKITNQVLILTAIIRMFNEDFAVGDWKQFQYHITKTKPEDISWLTYLTMSQFTQLKPPNVITESIFPSLLLIS